jgi:hypothetical protein
VADATAHLDDDGARRRRQLVLVGERSSIGVLHRADGEGDRRPVAAVLLPLNLAGARHRAGELLRVREEVEDALGRPGEELLPGDTSHRPPA